MMTVPALNVSREPYLEIVRKEPGVSTREVARRMGVDDSTADYHLRRLCRAGYIVRERGGRCVAHFMVGCVSRQERLLGRASRVGRAVYAVLRDAGRPLRASEVAAELRLNVSAAHYALGQLVRLGLVRKVRRGACEVVL